MDLSSYSLEELILTAIKTEIEARETYASIAREVPNAFLKDRLLFLSDEEDKHRAFLEKVYDRNFPGKEVVLPDETPVPLPEIKMEPGIPLTDVFQMAMDAEQAANEFYLEMAKLFPDDKQVRNGLEYLASMEMGHYKMLSIEREELARMEDYDAGWELMHLGP
jgi:rubrerythrin